MDQVNFITDEIAKMKAGGVSSVFSKQVEDQNGNMVVVNDFAAAEQALKAANTALMDNYKKLNETIEAVKQDYLTTIDAVAGGFADVNKQLDFQNNLLEHNRKIMQLTKGDKAYKELDKYYQSSYAQQQQRFAQYQREVNYWRQQMSSVATDSDDFKKYKQNWQNAVANLNSTTEAMLNTLSQKYSNKVNQILDDWQKKITNGLGLEAVGDRWDYVKQRGSEVLDQFNKSFEINKFLSAGEDYLNQMENNLAGQKAIKKVMNQQEAILKQKQNVTKYDVDRANLLLKIEAKRAEIESANANKTKLRLRRDAQGNYSYQYVAEESGINKAKQELEDLQKELYDFTKNGTQQAADNVYNAVSGLEEDLAKVWAAAYENDEERLKDITALYQKYGDLITRAIDDYSLRGGHLEDLGLDLAPSLFGIDAEYYQNLSDEQKSALMDRLTGGMLSGGGIASLVNTLQAEGGFNSWFSDLNAQLQNNASTTQSEMSLITAGDTQQNKNAQSTSKALVQLSEEQLESKQKELDATKALYQETLALAQSYKTLKDAALEAAQAGMNVQLGIGRSSASAWLGLNDNYGVDLENGLTGLGDLNNLVLTTGINNNNNNNNSSQNGITQGWQTPTLGGLSGSINSGGALTNNANGLGISNSVLNSVASSAAASTRSAVDMLIQGIKDLATSLPDTSGINNNTSQNVYINADFPNATSALAIQQAFQGLANRVSQYIT